MTWSDSTVCYDGGGGGGGRGGGGGGRGGGGGGSGCVMSILEILQPKLTRNSWTNCFQNCSLRTASAIS